MNLAEFLATNRLGLYIEKGQTPFYDERHTIVEVDTDRQWVGRSSDEVIYKYLTEK